MDEYAAIRDRLADGRCPALLQVTTAIDAQSAVEALPLSTELATAMVAPTSGEGDDIDEAGFKVTQTETEGFGVIVALMYPAGIEQWVAVRDQLKAALRGWLPDWATTAIRYRGHSLLNYSIGKENGRWLHLFRFSFTRQESYEVQT